MKSITICILLSICSLSAAVAQTLTEARELYLAGEYAKALPIFEAEHEAKPTDPSLNQWYGASLYETGGDLKKAEECLVFASKKGIQDSFFYLGNIYTEQYRFDEASTAFNKYETLLNKKNPRKKKEDKEKDELASAKLQEKKKVLSRLHRMVSNTEDIQIIDSVVVDKSDFLSAYKLSLSSGHLEYFNKVFTTNRPVESTIYFNEKETKIYYAQPDTSNTYKLYSMEKLINDYGNEKRLSETNFGLTGDMNYPYMMSDGVTIYFAANDEESVGGYDLFVSRYNMNNDTYLTPERMNMPFNSIYNDYMMVVDEEKGVGWFASDRFQPESKVCIYTFIPNTTVKIVDSEDEQYKTNRALITSIKDSWLQDVDYKKQIALARKSPEVKAKEIRDFDFVINDAYTYYRLADFKNKAAQDSYFRVIQLKAELKGLEVDLDNKRTTYMNASANDKRNMTSSILSLESKTEQIKKEIPTLEIQARNLERQELK